MLQHNTYHDGEDDVADKVVAIAQAGGVGGLEGRQHEAAAGLQLEFTF